MPKHQERRQQPTAPLLESGNIDINIIRGRNSETLNVDVQSTPKLIVSRFYTPAELANKTVIFVCSGKRLNNDVAIGLQGVRNGSFIHTQIIDTTQAEYRANKNQSTLTLTICGVGLGVLWAVYFANPAYFSFLSKTLLIAFSEILGIFIYNNNKR